MQKNWLFLAFGMPGLTLEELPALVTSMVQGAEAEPHVLAASHCLLVVASSQTYLLFFCACALVETIKTIQGNKSNKIQVPNRR